MLLQVLPQTLLPVDLGSCILGKILDTLEVEVSITLRLV